MMKMLMGLAQSLFFNKSIVNQADSKLHSGSRQHRTKRFMSRVALFLCLLTLQVSAREIGDSDQIPHLNSQGKEGYIQFIFSEMHRAFAIAPGGVWAWHSGEVSSELAQRIALKNCNQRSQQPCIIYAVNDDLVFDEDQWHTLWGPYKTITEADTVPVGTGLGERFPDLSFSSETGTPLKISDFAGKVLLIHFWGSWCPPCCNEIPDLQMLSDLLSKNDDIEVIMLQVRESFLQSQEWAKKLEVPITLYDSGVIGEDDNDLMLADGTTIEDRKLASTFPTTYVIDGNGLVIFSHQGAISRWNEYLPFLHDAAKHTAQHNPNNEAIQYRLSSFSVTERSAVGLDIN